MKINASGSTLWRAVDRDGNVLDILLQNRRDTAAARRFLAMVFKLVESAQDRWHAITGASLVALVSAGAKFENGILAEREEAAAA